MASVKLIHVDKFYTKENQVVFDFNIDIKDKEFIVFVGPSGCGKSTTLRMIAGLEDITNGELYIDDVLSNQIQAKDRGISMVFQSYALFPTMSVRKNIAYGLSIRKFPYEVRYKDGTKVMIIDKKKIKEIERQIKHIRKDIKYAAADIEAAENDEEKISASERLERLNALEEKFNNQLEFYKTTPVPKIFYKHNPKDETAKRVEEIAEALELTPYLDRKPNQLSGGQRQRVALGRAIARKAKVFLMDEPLSNLDAKLRVQMRKEITALHKRLGATTIYVTHDQLEAMTMADRIVVMKKGVVQQLDTPTVIYDHPANLFVATFIGSPTINLIDATAKNGELIFANNKLLLEGDRLSKVKSYDKCDVILGIRPEDIITSLPNKIEKNDKNTWYDAEVTLVEILGNDSIIHFVIGDKDFQTFSEDQEIVLGSKIKYRFRNDRIHMFEKDSEITIF